MKKSLILAIFLCHFVDIFAQSTTPARNMTLKEAYEFIADKHKNKQLILSPAPKYENGSLIIPNKRQFALKPWDEAKKVFFKFPDLTFADGKIINSVMITYDEGLRHGIEDVDIRNLVGLFRLSEYLFQKGVVEIYTLGLNGSERTDVHGEGRAIDFKGVRFYTGFQIDVKKDWASKPILDEKDPTIQLTTNKWAFGTRNLIYRLNHPNADPYIKTFFQELYSFLSKDYQDIINIPDEGSTPTASIIGGKSYIMHPDHHQSNNGDDSKVGRETHRDHIHIQIGKTGAMYQ